MLLREIGSRKERVKLKGLGCDFSFGYIEFEGLWGMKVGMFSIRLERRIVWSLGEELGMGY